MDIVRGAVLGSLVGALAAFAVRRRARQAAVAFPVPAPHLETLPPVAEKIREFGEIATSAAATQTYKTLVTTADEFARLLRTLERTQQFSCNRLIQKVERLCKTICDQMSFDGSALCEDVRSICETCLHNKLLQL